VEEAAINRPAIERAILAFIIAAIAVAFGHVT
jgi:hypothetical protein